ncbi:GLPGLI family protein [Wenyingzhuangia sp. 1_MG-2023]|nr:GLPGLI family protein [Wenyingzhuangia sp. 1_MG-2023]
MKTLIYTCVLLFSTGLFAQNSQGKAFYIIKNQPNTDFMKGRKIPEGAKERIKEMQNKLSVKNYVLTFEKDISLFEELQDNSQEVPSDPRRGMMQLMMSQNSGTVYKNIATKELVAQKEIYDKQFLIKDKLQDWAWEKGDEVKMIGSYTCFKASTSITKTLPARGDEEEKEISIPITAWYTIEIPVSHGPEMFWGLPGLILEVQAGDRVLACSKIELRGQDLEIEAPSKGKKISLEKYEITLAKKAQEVKEMMESRRRGGGGPGGRK